MNRQRQPVREIGDNLKWHEVIGDPTLANAILDRLVHNAYKLDLKGDSMRKRSRSWADHEFGGAPLGDARLSG